MNFFKNIFAFLALFLLSLPAIAETGEAAAFENWMRYSGKINVVIAVISTIFLGIIVYLIRIDRKLGKLEKELEENN